MKTTGKFALLFALLLIFAPAYTHAQPSRLALNLLKQGASKAGMALRNAASKPTVWKMPTLRPTIPNTAGWLKNTPAPSAGWKMPALYPTSSIGSNRLHSMPLADMVAPASQRIAYPGLSRILAAPQARQLSRPLPLVRKTNYRISPEAGTLGAKAIKAVAKGYVKDKKEEEQRKRRQQ